MRSKFGPDRLIKYKNLKIFQLKFSWTFFPNPAAVSFSEKSLKETEQSSPDRFLSGKIKKCYHYFATFFSRKSLQSLVQNSVLAIPRIRQGAVHDRTQRIRQIAVTQRTAKWFGCFVETGRSGIIGIWHAWCVAVWQRGDKRLLWQKRHLTWGACHSCDVPTFLIFPLKMNRNLW